MNIKETSFSLYDGNSMRGWLCEPTGQAEKNPAVLVIHEALGLVENIKPVLRRFAQSGYVTFAPDLFDQPEPGPICIAKSMLAMMTNEGDALRDLDSATRFLQKQSTVDENRLAVAGFCMGGGFALLMALRPGIKASAPYYGSSPVYFQQIEKSCPVVASYGKKDMIFRAPAENLQIALAETGIEHDFKIYDNAGHSYMTEDLPGPLYTFGKIGPLQVGYRPDEAEDSWQRMLDFFGKHV